MGGDELTLLERHNQLMAESTALMRGLLGHRPDWTGKSVNCDDQDECLSGFDAVL